MMKMNVTVKMRMPGAGDMPAQTTGQFAGMSGNRGMRAMPQRQRDCAVSDCRQAAMQSAATRPVAAIRR